ncbi:uncharacterized protein LOC121404538 [Drosophila obscura]|uniref:uncharacterized protein LOC121404538 n=1 Tax=Drosophila obscura TaxID=7282 RepID=UPI001BB1C08A|nr:uncharacterized protein LOC121404538 [Drosophila obscura]
MNNYTTLFNMDSGSVASIENIPETQQQCTMNKLEQTMDLIIQKLDRNTTELVALRTEMSSIKAKVFGAIQKTKETMPNEPLSSIGELESFEESLKEETVFKKLILDLGMSSEKAFDKWIRSTWRSIVSDEVARQCSWRGTDAKKCIRGLRVTLAIRNSLKI